MSTVTFTIHDHGDSIERKWWPAIKADFPSYEPLWAKHVAPLTYRPASIYLREGIEKKLARMATTNYGVFIHLAGCHRQILHQETDPDLDLFVAEGMYAFYSRLYSVREAVCQFVDALGDVLEKYGGRSTKRTSHRTFGKASTLIAYLEPGLSGDFDAIFAEQSFLHRTQEVHFWGFPVINGKIPTREYLSTWLDSGLRQHGLAALSAFLNRPDRDAVFADPKNFIDPIEQARTELKRFATVIDRAWQVALRELENIKDQDGYRDAQNEGLSETPPTKIAAPVSSEALAASGKA